MRRLHPLRFWLFVQTLMTAAVWRAAAVTTADMILLTASATNNPLRVTLQWPKPTLSSYNYTVSRRELGQTNYTTLASFTDSNAVSYVDTTIAAGKIYEYRVMAGGVTGFAASGVDVPLREQRGTIVVLVDETIAGACSNKLERLRRDLVGNGWKVLRRNVARDASNPAGNVTADASAVRSLLLADAAAHPDLQAVLLFGHVVIPFTGAGNPDGHGTRAMPCDGYYADLNETWTDTATLSTSAYPNNTPGDFRWDRNSIASRELMVGRVDFFALTRFAESETYLLNRYLDKTHHYRHGRINVPRRAIGALHSGGYNYNVYRTLSAYFGRTNIFSTSGMWSDFTANNAYLCGYAGVSGSTEHTSGISTSDMSTNDYKVVFTWFGASYMEEWWRTNNALRAALAMPTYTLTCGWSNYASDWQFERFAMGVPVGAALQGDTSRYPSDYNPFQYSTIWTALMGDPTLTMYVVAPPAAVTATVSGSNAVVNWTASPEPGLAGYHVYRGTNWAGAFTRLNTGLVTGTTYTDTTARVTDVLYMVRAVKLETRGTGTYTNASTGAFGSLTLDGRSNQPPTANDQSFMAVEDTPTPVTLTGADPDGDPLDYSIVIHPNHGRLSGTPPNVVYTSRAHYNGPDHFTFITHDGLADSTVAMVTVTVTPVNDPPVASNQTITAYQYQGLPSEALLFATDVEDDFLTYRITSQPAHGVAVLVDGTVAQYTPAAGYTGPDSFTYVANDGQADSLPATVTVNVVTNLQLDANLLGYWRFDGSTSNSVTNAYHGVLSGGATITAGAGVSGSALRVTGPGQGCPLEPITPYVNGYVYNQTASFWFKADDIAPTNRYQVVMEMGGDLREAWSVYLRGNTLFVHARSSGQSNDTLQTAAIVTGRWHHVALCFETYQGRYLTNRFAAYLDGQLLGRTRCNSFYRLDNPSGIGNVNGSTCYDAVTTARTNDAWFAGAVDEVRVYTRRLQPPQIRALYNMFAVTARGTSVQWLLDRFGPQPEWETIDEADADGDGQPTWAEYRAGTEPRNAADVLHIGAVTTGQVTFATVAGRSYEVEYRLDLTTGAWQPLPGGVGRVTGTGQVVTITDPEAERATRRFYRVRLTEW